MHVHVHVHVRTLLVVAAEEPQLSPPCCTPKPASNTTILANAAMSLGGGNVVLNATWTAPYLRLFDCALPCLAWRCQASACACQWQQLRHSAHPALGHRNTIEDGAPTS